MANENARPWLQLTATMQFTICKVTDTCNHLTDTQMSVEN